MTKETFLLALDAEHLKAGPDGVAVPEDRDVTVIVATPGETIHVSKVVKMELLATSLCLQTAKAERYWLTYDLVLGLRLRADKAAGAQKAGFAR
jgi:hypothetical protein